MDRALKEQGVLYVMHVDPETHKPNLSYFEVIEMDKKLIKLSLDYWLLLKGPLPNIIGLNSGTN